jgi:putative hemolysin
MIKLIGQIKDSTQLRWNRVHKFQSKINFHIEVGSYIVKTAETFGELIESFKLRHEVFNQEFRGLDWDGMDFDKYDYYFDHLLIIHQETSKIIGTYRLNCSTFSNKSYTGQEFDISLLRLQQGPFLELGRACIHKDFRKGSVISLLWRGIAEYMNQSSSNILFGCSSVKISNAREAALVFKYLQDQALVTHQYLCKPTKQFKMKHFEAWYHYFNRGLNTKQIEEAQVLIPSLLKSYLKLGAKVAAEPAYDVEFNCIDLLTVLKKDDLDQSLVQKYKVA